MGSFINRCNFISPLSEQICSELQFLLKTKVIKKGELISKQNQTNMSLYYVESGLVKHFYYRNNRPLILQFFKENSFFLILDSFLSNKPSEFMTTAIETTRVSYLEYQNIEKLASKYHQFETLYRKIMSRATLGTYNRFKDIFEHDATSRYDKFLVKNPELMQRISLGDLAAYLGISQVSLSRIRAK